MAKHSKPLAGSRAYWPKKRAKRIYPKFIVHKKYIETNPLGFIGYKVGMGRTLVTDNKKGSVTFGKDVVLPFTVIECPSLVISGVRGYRKSYIGLEAASQVWASSLSRDLSRKTNVPKKPEASDGFEKLVPSLSELRLIVHTQPKQTGLKKKRPELMEIPISGNVQKAWEWSKSHLGKELSIRDVFKDGDWIDVIGITKGKGFQGVVKRFGVKIRSRKNEKKRRHIGSLGPYTPARVLPGKIAMAGQLGFQRRTEWNKRILKISEPINPKSGWPNYGTTRSESILVQGTVPGPAKRLILMRHAEREPKSKEPVTINKIVV